MCAKMLSTNRVLIGAPISLRCKDKRVKIIIKQRIYAKNLE